MGWLKKILFKKWNICETEIQCQCGRINKVLITPTLLRPHPGDSNELRAWKMMKWAKIIEAQKWYEERERDSKKA